MRQTVTWWKWVVIVIGALIILIGVGRWVYQRLVSTRVPLPASPEQAAKEYEEYIGYPVKPPPAQR
ncbi:MAG: hypothetical protein ACUVSC_10300 [Candidatus Fervidibacter sp.]|uniref:hypothetical protein n=1 Tax=Candidatus Fervidibacter sp. TaxID=3100871 RepID=UPI00404A8167